MSILGFTAVISLALVVVCIALNKFSPNRFDQLFGPRPNKDKQS